MVNSSKKLPLTFSGHTDFSLGFIHDNYLPTAKYCGMFFKVIFHVDAFIRCLLGPYCVPVPGERD